MVECGPLSAGYGCQGTVRNIVGLSEGFTSRRWCLQVVGGVYKS